MVETFFFFFLKVIYGRNSNFETMKMQEMKEKKLMDILML